MNLFAPYKPRPDAPVRSTPRAEAAGHNPTDRIGQLEEELDRLTLVCAAMWELLEARLQVTQEDLAAQVAKVDARDGTVDGKLTHAVSQCPECARTMSPRHRRCLYCGFDLPPGGVFESL
jgi:hypothetical protein